MTVLPVWQVKMHSLEVFSLCLSILCERSSSSWSKQIHSLKCTDDVQHHIIAIMTSIMTKKKCQRGWKLMIPHQSWQNLCPYRSGKHFNCCVLCWWKWQSIWTTISHGCSHDTLTTIIVLIMFFRKPLVSVHYKGQTLKRLLDQRWAGHLVTEDISTILTEEERFKDPQSHSLLCAKCSLFISS